MSFIIRFGKKFNFWKNTGEHYNSLWGCHGNVIRNANPYEIWKWKKCASDCYLSYVNLIWILFHFNINLVWKGDKIHFIVLYKE